MIKSNRITKPRFSVITITYNAKNTILPTIRSVIEQSYQEIEYIIIDGGSSDGTLDIIKRYEQHVDVLVSEPDKGIYDAMNKGLQRATGDYVWFMNAGDAFHSNFVLRDTARVIAVEKNAPDVVYGETALVDDKRNFLSMRRLRAPRELTWKSFKWGMLVCHQAFVVKRTIAPSYDLQYRFSSDYDWCIRILQKANGVINVGETLADYLSEGVTTKNRKASLKERFRIMCNYYGKPTVYILHLWFALRTFVARLTGDNT